MGVKVGAEGAGWGFSPAQNTFDMWSCLCFWNTLPKCIALGQKQRCHTEDPVKPLPDRQPGAGSSGLPVIAGVTGISTGTALPGVLQSHKKVKLHLYFGRLS